MKTITNECKKCKTGLNPRQSYSTGNVKDNNFEFNVYCQDCYNQVITEMQKKGYY